MTGFGLANEIESEAWHRLHPLSPVVRFGGAVVPVAVILTPSLLSGDSLQAIGDSITHLIAGLGLIAFGFISWLVTRWKIEGESLRIETGVLLRSSSKFPLVQIQAIDTVRPVLARVLGLAELRLRMGGSEGNSGRLAYLPADEAERVRARLLALAHGLGHDTPEPPETVLTSVPTGRLLASAILSRVGFVLTVVLLLWLAAIRFLPDSLSLAVNSATSQLTGFATFFALLTAAWRRFNSEYKLTVADAPDGLRIRAGLLQTSAETIPRGRVQAVHLTEPFIWRPFGWCRLEIDVAGHTKQGQNNQTLSQQLRPVLPVGSRAEADRLLTLLIPGAPTATWPPPRRARFKSPLSFHYLAWGRTNECAVSTSGRVTKSTSWVPLAKVQSVRLVQGPVQRRLKLSTLHLDAAGRNVNVSLVDRDIDEAESLVNDLSVLCRYARELHDARHPITPIAN